MIKAEIVADSLNEHGQRLTTFVCTFPRIILAELNTHRMFSRNSASSRAIPFDRMLKMVQDDPFIPIKWLKTHKGMQGYEEIDEFYKDAALSDWLGARDAAVSHAIKLDDLGVTKQLCNRILEPFLWHKALITSTEWENFFALRAHEAAEIHIQQLAYEMLHEYQRNRPTFLKAGQWHIPFGDNIKLPPTIPIPEGLSLDEGVELRKVMVATARCARVSYLNFEGKDDYEVDIKLHDRLLESGHMSPFEHCARAMSEDEFGNYVNGLGFEDWGGTFSSHQMFDTKSYGWCGNFRGFIQYRKMIKGENKSDNRIKKYSNDKQTTSGNTQEIP